VANAHARRSVLRGTDVGRGRLRRVGRVGTHRGTECGGARAWRRGVDSAADDGDWRAGLLRVARRSETLCAVEHRVRADSPARAADDSPARKERSQPGALRARAEGSGRVVRDLLKAFVEHLRLNENASAHTVRAYESDLSQYLAFLASHLGRRVSELTPGDLDHLNARAFLSDRSRRGNSKASAARKLSSIRAFGKYLRREGVLDGDPAAFVGTPKREQRIPNHLAVEEMSKLLDTPDTSSP